MAEELLTGGQVEEAVTMLESDDQPADADDATEHSTDGTEASESESDDQPTYKVKVNGKVQEVSLKELREGYQRLADYTRKTQELAAQRQAFEREQATLKRLADEIESDPVLQQALKERLFEKRYGRKYDPRAEAQITQSREMIRSQVESGLTRFALEHPDMTDDQLHEVVQQMAAIVQRTGSLPDPRIVYNAMRAEQLEEENKALKARQKQGMVVSRGKVTPIQGRGGSAPGPKARKVTLDGNDGSVSAKAAAAALLRQLDTD